MRLFFDLGILTAIAVMLATGCASKGWVQDLVGKKTAEVDVRSNQRLEGVEGRVAEAQTSARRAFVRADEVDSRVSRLWANRHVRKLVDTAHLQFAFDRSDLDDRAQTTLSGLVKELQANPALTVDLEGYADTSGQREYNVALSQRRVESVRRYLVGSGVSLSRINSVGLGTLENGGLSNAQKRRVTVKLMVDVD